VAEFSFKVAVISFFDKNHVLSDSRVHRHYFKHEYNDEKKGTWRLLGAEIARVLEQPDTSPPAL